MDHQRKEREGDGEHEKLKNMIKTKGFTKGENNDMLRKLHKCKYANL